ELRAAFERVLPRVAPRGPVKAARVGEEAEIADLQQAVEGDGMLARPRLRQPERGQDAAVQVAEDEIRPGAHRRTPWVPRCTQGAGRREGGSLAGGARLARRPAGRPEPARGGGPGTMASLPHAPARLGV